ncbi:MAG TPA: HAD hydrolase-like protein [Candidatus Norongarragalinales archaeon]|nr:HAD hydrolase-like protein [Candidatus Norongarragalinales archaeon]
MGVLIWDFDGVIVDTVRECYILTLRTIAKQRPYLASEAGIEKFSPIPFRDFETYRSKSVNAADFFANYILHMAGKELNEENLEMVTEKHRPFLKKMDVAFYEEREKLMNEDKDAYFRTLKVYKGIPEVLGALSGLGIRHAIMSARDSHSIRQILAHFKLLSHFEFIIGHEVNKGDRHVKGKQISLLKRHFAGMQGPIPDTSIEYFFIDDIPFNLRKVAGETELLFAGWGYGKLEEGYVEAKKVKKPGSLLTMFRA